MASIILPAFNEAAVIERSIRSLLSQVSMEDEIIICCNGCADDTAMIARRFEPRVTVLETDIPSKTHALNLADRHASTFPRVYMDADVELSDGALSKLKDALNGKLLAVSPSVKMDLGNSNWGVKAYYDIWLSLPYCQTGMIGAGVYALSEEGRSRFEQFPEVIADDGYVRALFRENERGRVKDAFSIVHGPSDLYWLIKIKTRSRLGQIEFASKFPDLLSNEEKNYSVAIKRVMTDPCSWIKFFVYVYVNLLSRNLARKASKNLHRYQWEKDVSSRIGTKESSEMGDR